MGLLQHSRPFPFPGCGSAGRRPPKNTTIDDERVAIEGSGTPADAHAAPRTSNIDGERRTPAAPRSTKRLWSRRRPHVLPVGAARHQNKIKRSRRESTSAASVGGQLRRGAPTSVCEARPALYVGGTQRDRRPAAAVTIAETKGG